MKQVDLGFLQLIFLITYECYSYRRFEGFIILHGKMFIPSFYREDQLIVPYKYAKVDRDLFIYEFISRPHVQGIGQGYVNRCLFVLASDWQGNQCSGSFVCV